ncbi:DUF4837 family protein [Flavobacterium sp. Sd200]|uniref:DUF4837 family protein n=1 Tax=Flavobacterium sp. Sd200 TaxID=2692211 RepID=UPI001F3232C6|nr:DUF4837 family protein [Flavobacterium sp. Sd200]
MKRVQQIMALVAIVCCTLCCSNKDDVASSEGEINEISIIISDVLWNGEVGDSLRKKLAAPVDGLTMEEPIFTINQYHSQSFGGSLKRGRNIIFVEKGEEKDFDFKQDRTCAPQNTFTISGKNTAELLQIIQMHADEIIRTIRQTEIAVNQYRNEKAGLMDDSKFRQKYGISIKMPLAYNAVLKDDNFIWLKKEIPGGNTNMLLYRVPFATVEHNKDIINNIIKMRDSIGIKYIHGKDPDTYMVTEEAYSPYVFMTSFKEKHAFEMRGNWEMKNDFMNGPFVNYAIRDDKNKYYLIIEGFIYSPSSPKRDLIVELESIIKSVKFI